MTKLAGVDFIGVLCLIGQHARHGAGSVTRFVGAGSGEGSQPSPMAPKRSMTPARRQRIWDTAKGLCARCSEPVALDTCDIDHRIPLWISRDDSDDNLAPMHRDCHRQVKTKIDAGITKAQLRVLKDLAAGGCFFAALRRASDYMADGVLFSESVGIVVHRYRVRDKTVAPLYTATPPLVIDCSHGNNGGGWRDYEITDAGRAMIASSSPPQRIERPSEDQARRPAESNLGDPR